MRRKAAQSELDAAVGRSAVTLVLGLPRVGRTSLLNDWQNRRTDTKWCSSTGDLQLDPGILVVDHVENRVVDGIIAFVRMAEVAKSRTRLVIAPADLVTAHRLRTTLPGIVHTVEVNPLQPGEVADELPLMSSASGPIEALPTASGSTNQPPIDPYRHWLRGGLPDSLAAESDRSSLGWRRAMLQDLLSRDYTQWKVEKAFPLGDVLLWLANQNGSELDETSCRFANRTELRSAIHVLEQLGLVRRLSNFPAGSNVSMGKKRKIFIRDSGILHAILGIETWPQLRSHGAIGASFESYAGESLIMAGSERCGAQFYREKGDEGEDEIDLVLDFPSQNNRLVAIEFKVGPEQSAKKGFYRACAALAVRDRFIVHSGNESHVGTPVDRLDLKTAIKRVYAIACEG